MTSRRINIIKAVICAAAGVLGALIFLMPAFHAENRYSLGENMAFEITNLDQVVESIRAALKNRTAGIGIDISLKGEYMDDIEPLVSVLMELAMEHTGIPDEGDYIKYQLGGYDFSYGHSLQGNSYRYSIVIKPRYYDTAPQEEAVDEKVREILSSEKISKAPSEYDRIRAVYEYIAENVKYDKVHKSNKYYTLKSTAYGALVNNTAVCQGYAVAMYRLLLELGTDCRVVTGKGVSAAEHEEDHAWNLVIMDGQEYYVDPTWNYTVSENDYFMKKAEEFPNHIAGQRG